MDSKAINEFFKDLYNTDPKFQDFINKFGEVLIKPAIEAIQDGDEEKAKNLLMLGFAVVGAQNNPSEMIKFIPK